MKTPIALTVFLGLSGLAEIKGGGKALEKLEAERAGKVKVYNDFQHKNRDALNLGQHHKIEQNVCGTLAAQQGVYTKATHEGYALYIGGTYIGCLSIDKDGKPAKIDSPLNLTEIGCDEKIEMDKSGFMKLGQRNLDGSPMDLPPTRPNLNNPIAK